MNEPMLKTPTEFHAVGQLANALLAQTDEALTHVELEQLRAAIDALRPDLDAIFAAAASLGAVIAHLESLGSYESAGMLRELVTSYAPLFAEMNQRLKERVQDQAEHAQQKLTSSRVTKRAPKIDVAAPANSFQLKAVIPNPALRRPAGRNRPPAKR